MKNFRITSVFVIIFFIAIFCINVKLALGVLFLSTFFLIAFQNLKCAFYIFLFLLPLSFNIPIRLPGLYDVFLVDILIIIMFIVYLVKKVLKNDIKIKLNFLTYSIVLFILVSIISIILSRFTIGPNEYWRINFIFSKLKYVAKSSLAQHLRPTFIVSNFFVFFRILFPVFIYLIIDNISIKEKDIQIILKIILASALVTVFYGWLFKLGLIPEEIYSLFGEYYKTNTLIRISSTFANPQSYGTFLVLPISICFLKILRKPMAIHYYILIILFLSVFVFTYCIASFAVLSVVLIFLTFFQKNINPIFKFFAIIIIFIGIIFILHNDQIIFQKIKYSLHFVNARKKYPSTLQMRVSLWTVWWKVLKNHLLLGLGYPLAVADNNYIWMTANAGLIGLVLYFSIVIIFVKRAIKYINIYKENILGYITIVTALQIFIHGFSFDISLVFKITAFFFIFSALVSKKLNEEKNII